MMRTAADRPRGGTTYRIQIVILRPPADVQEMQNRCSRCVGLLVGRCERTGSMFVVEGARLALGGVLLCELVVIERADGHLFCRREGFRALG